MEIELFQLLLIFAWIPVGIGGFVGGHSANKKIAKAKKEITSLKNRLNIATIAAKVAMRDNC